MSLIEAKAVWKRTDFFFFNDTTTTEIYTLSLHDALPIFKLHRNDRPKTVKQYNLALTHQLANLPRGDRKSTRLNSSHSQISYAVFCLKKIEAKAVWKRTDCSVT